MGVNPLIPQIRAFVHSRPMMINSHSYWPEPLKSWLCYYFLFQIGAPVAEICGNDRVKPRMDFEIATIGLYPRWP
jgi:hypothetical protein